MYTKKTINTVKAVMAILFMLISALVMQACPAEVEEEEDGDPGFWAQDLTNNTFYRVPATLLAEGSYCKVWVEDSSSNVDTGTAKKIAKEYDGKIYQKMLDAFDYGQFTLVDKNDNPIAKFKNILYFTDWLTDNDGKLCILLLDIRDGYTQQGGSYTGGYFWGGNFLETKDMPYSNMMDMIYLDTYPAEPSSEESYQTLAHELQHLMNAATTVLVRNDLMDLWIDEGLSSAAEYIYLEKQVKERYDWFNKDHETTIAKGNNFFVWGNLKDTSILDEYATVYLFFQWLRIQADGSDIYKNIMWSGSYDYRAVTAAAKKNISWFDSETSWESLFKPWLAANYINAASGRYGYNNDLTLKDVKAKTASNGTTSLQLLPGEAVYSKTNTQVNTSTYASGSGTNIKYAGLKKEEPSVSDSQTFAGGWLLTYNASTSGNGAKENGQLTGLAETSIIARSSSVGGSEELKPVRIDARDMLARNGHNGGGGG
jgi:hypothetical protein